MRNALEDCALEDQSYVNDAAAKAMSFIAQANLTNIPATTGNCLLRSAKWPSWKAWMGIETK